MINVQVEPIPVSEATIGDFIDELIERLGVDPDTIDPSDKDELECFISAWAQSYWTADTPFDSEV